MARKSKWRVVYGESLPAWEKLFPTRKAAREFALAQLDMGDIVFRISKVIPGDGHQSITAVLDAARAGE